MGTVQNPGWLKIGPAHDFPECKIIARSVGPETVFIHHHGQKWFAFEALCPHMSRPLDNARIEANTLECTWHNMRFDLKSGTVIEDSGFFDIPALKVYTVKVEGDEVFIKLKH